MTAPDPWDDDNPYDPTTEFNNSHPLDDIDVVDRNDRRQDAVVQAVVQARDDFLDEWADKDGEKLGAIVMGARSAFKHALETVPEDAGQDYLDALEYEMEKAHERKVEAQGDEMDWWQHEGREAAYQKARKYATKAVNHGM